MTNLSVDKCSGENCPCKLRKKKPVEILSEFGVTMREAVKNIKAPIIIVPTMSPNPYVRELQDQLGKMLEEERIRYTQYRH